MARIRSNVVIPAVAGIIILTALCIITAIFLFEQQSAMTLALQENVASRRAAVDLEECLYDMSALLSDGVSDVSALNKRMDTHLAALQRVADQPEELHVVTLLMKGKADYLEHWSALPPAGSEGFSTGMLETLKHLEEGLIAPCQTFRLYNGRLLEQSALQHEHVLASLAWGMAGIGILGGVAGIGMGFVLTRALGQSLRRLQVQLRDAAGKLERELPEVIVTEEGYFSGVHAQLDNLTSGIETVIRDLRQRELEVLRSEQLAAVGQLAAGVAHEIRNPLTAIKMLIQSARECTATPLADEDLRVIEAEIRRMERSLRTFLDFARPPKPERRRIFLPDILNEVRELVRGRAARQKVEIMLVPADSPVHLMADAEQLRQVFVNLILNSLDELPQGGWIRVVQTADETSTTVSVIDSGPGIAEDMLEQLFRPFSSNKETGLGLGLVICRRIVEDHGGSIRPENPETGGAAFHVRLPRETPDPLHDVRVPA